mgnify:FL=1
MYRLPALPLRIDIIGEIGDAVVSCAIVENGKRAESNDLLLSVIICRFRDEHRIRIMMRFNHALRCSYVRGVMSADDPPRMTAAL